MQQDFLCSPINRQVGCKQYSSSVVGGPASTTLPVCSVFVCDDNCSTGNLTYNITDLADFYGKRLVILKSVDTTATGFNIRIVSPSSNFITTGSTTLNLPDLPSTTELIFPIGAGSEIGVTSYDGPFTIPSKAIFAVSTPDTLLLEVSVANSSLPGAYGTFSVNAARGNYNNAGSDLDLTTGDYTPSESFSADICASFYLLSDTSNGYGYVDFYNVTDAAVMNECKFSVSTAGLWNPTQNMNLKADLVAGKTYRWRQTNTLSSDIYTMKMGLFSINKI